MPAHSSDAIKEEYKTSEAASDHGQKAQASPETQASQGVSD